MIRCTVDTNVPIVANGRSVRRGAGKIPSVECRTSAVRFLTSILKSGKILLDLDSAIQSEYRKHLNPRGQPGVGDRFYQAVLHSAPRLIERVDLPKRADGEYVDLPRALIKAKFDRSDRKFAALAKREQVRVVNAIDSDWLQHLATLEANGIAVKFICGCDKTTWFTA